MAKALHLRPESPTPRKRKSERRVRRPADLEDGSELWQAHPLRTGAAAFGSSGDRCG